MKKLLLAGLITISSFAMAQKMKTEKGDLSFLKGQSVVNVVFDYSDLKLMKENMTETQYVEKHSAELNAKVDGNGESWKKQWSTSKENIWNPKFLSIANTVLTKEKNPLRLKEGVDAPYTLQVKVKWIYPGWDAGIMKQPAKVSTQLIFIDSQTKNVVCEISSQEAPGDQWGNNFSNEYRVGEGFAKTGKSLSQKIVKEVK
ncbi:MAG: hypothetical protein E2590_14170 [Chryseobacterium sp.]|nr:hypothetical protein [Chryseobacterium sp.]